MRNLYVAVPLFLVSTAVFAQQVRGIPTMSEYGVGALVVLVGAIGVWVARRK